MNFTDTHGQTMDIHILAQLVKTFLSKEFFHKKLLPKDNHFLIFTLFFLFFFNVSFVVSVSRLSAFYSPSISNVT